METNIIHEDPSDISAIANNSHELNHPAEDNLAIGRKNGDNSPESGSLYSDEIPSGYNSGEQYDTLSTGYMSGEAYELPETRMDLREPTLGKLAEEENELELRPSSRRTSSDSSENEREEVEALRNPECEANPKSPSGGKLFSHSRPGKMKPPSFAIPMIECPMLEGSEGGLYKAVPSDTDDTSAFESDVNRGVSMEEGCLSGDGGMTTSDSGAELLGDFRRRFGRRSRRYGGNASHSSGFKKVERDEEWFQHNDTKYWAVARGICFWSCLAFILICIGASGIVIFKMPKTCDPNISWYQGIVSAELNFAEDFQDINFNGGIPRLKEHGIRSIVLRENNPDVQNQSTLDYLQNRIPDFFNNKSLAQEFTGKLHDHEMNLIVEIPVVGDLSRDLEYWERNTLSLELQHTVANTIKFWSQRGVDGIILRGLDHFISDKWIGDAVSDWRIVMAKYGTSSQHKILITELNFAMNTGDELLINKMDLLDATLHIPENEFHSVYSALEGILNMTSWDTSLEFPWINWNLNSVRPLSNAILALHMMLPGTINVLREDIEYSSEIFKELVSLRMDSVPIFMNGNYRRCDCIQTFEKENNFQFKVHEGGLLQMERFYNRRNRFVYVGNFGSNQSLSLDPIGKMYNGGYLKISTGGNITQGDHYAEFRDISLDPGEAIVMKLPK